jgi:iron complex transport system permease protein
MSFQNVMVTADIAARRRSGVMASLVVLVVLLALASLGIGPVRLSPVTVIDALFGGGSDVQQVIVREIRLPRVILGFAIGAILGLSGAALQGLLRNPLASPSLFGAPQSAAFGAVLVISLGLADVRSYALPVAAIAMAFASVFVLLAIAGRNAGLLILILAGLAISSLAGAATALVMNLSSNPFVALEIAFWLLGSLEDRSFRHVMLALPFIVAGAIILFSQRNAFRALSLGEETAQSLGVDVGRLRLMVIAGVALGVGGAVAVTGTIGFIGLVAPHLMRPLIGHDPTRLLIPSALTGAEQRHQGRRPDLDHRRAVFPLSDHAGAPRARRRRRMTASAFLTAQGVSVRLSGRVVLRDISLALSPGHLVALVGPNGAGKTTLLRALAGLVPSEGAIQVGGDALSSLSLRERARRFAYLPQGHIVHWPLPARDIVALGRYPHGATDPARLTAKDSEAVLRAMQATDVVEFGARRVTELSGGERSRVALARVFAVEAPVILADEPTASLDPRHQIDVMKNLRQAADKGALVMVVTHDLGLAARFADTLVVLSEGRLVSQGAAVEALSEQVMADVFRISAYRAEFQREAVIVPWAEI